MNEPGRTSPALYSDLVGRTVFISGGATGIGSDLVAAFHRQGARVAFVDIDAGAAQALADDLMQETGRRPDFTLCDVTDTPALLAAMQAAEASGSGLDVLVNNAANDTRRTFAEVTPELWDASVAVNLKHQFLAAQAAHAMMRPRGRGSVINFGSVAPVMGIADLDAYSTCKAAVRGLTRQLARTMGHDGIRVNTIVPGCIMTPRQLELWISPEDEAKILADQCLHRRLVGHDVAEMALFLASDASSACTAQEFIVDGGIT